MAKEEAVPVKPSSEVDSIRKILFGDQVAQTEERFSSLEKAIAQLRNENRNLRQALEAELSEREQATEKLWSFIQSALTERDEAWATHLAAQTDLVDIFMSGLDQYKKKLAQSTNHKPE